MLSPRRRGTTPAVCLLFLAPALHPLLLPVVGVPSHLLWFAHVLPVAWLTYHRGRRTGLVSIAMSLTLLTIGERAFGRGYFNAADWQTVTSLAVALGFTNALVAGFADYARRAHSLQQQLWQSQKMETLGLFAASVAHDFSNMITAITLTTEMALGDCSGDGPCRAHFAEIQRSAARASMLSKRLLAFGRREVVQPAELDVSVVVRDLETMLRRLVATRADLRIATEDVPLVVADRGHVEQILLNLVVNASDAIPATGSITISARAAAPGDVPPAAVDVPFRRYVLLEVADTGIGMSSAIQRRIFEPLFTTKAPGKGTGLGLSTVRDLTAHWNGYVTVSSTVGRGSTFRVFLPALLGEPPAYVDDADREPAMRLAS